MIREGYKKNVTLIRNKKTPEMDVSGVDLISKKNRMKKKSWRNRNYKNAKKNKNLHFKHKNDAFSLDFTLNLILGLIWL